MSQTVMLPCVERSSASEILQLLSPRHTLGMLNFAAHDVEEAADRLIGLGCDSQIYEYQGYAVKVTSLTSTGGAIV